MARKYSNTSVETTLVNSINSSETSIQINDTGGLPATFPYSIILDYQGSTIEVVTVTNVSGSTLTVTRGQDGTAAQSHDAGAVVVHGATARDLSEPQEHIDATSNVHGVTGGAELVGTTSTQILTNKTIAGDSNTLTIALDDLANVTVPSPVDGQLIAFSTALSAWQANGIVAPPDVQTFTSSGTWNKPVNARWVWVRSQGGGGGGAGADDTASGQVSVGVGGGGGAYAESILDAVAVGSSETVTVGAGGAGVTGGSGQSGGNSSFGAHVIADGSAGGSSIIAPGTSLAIRVTSARGLASSSTGQIKIDGSPGGFAIRLSGGEGASGYGGASFLGGSANGGDLFAGTAIAGLGFGGGGGGALADAGTGPKAGGAGASGIVAVVTFF